MHPFTPVTGPSAWFAEQFKHSTEHIYDLSTEDISELDAAVAAVIESGKDIQVSLEPQLEFCGALKSCLDCLLQAMLIC